MVVVAAPRRASQRGRALLRGPLGWLIGVAALYLVGRDVEWSELGARLASLSLTHLVVATAFALLAVYAKAARWALLVPQSATAARPSGRTLFPVVLAGQLVNNGLPLRLGELLRIEALASRGIARATGLSTVIVEKLSDGVALAATAALLSLLITPPDWLNRGVVAAGAVAALGLGLGVIAGPRLARLVARANDRVARIFVALVASVARLRQPRTATGVVAWTLLAWVVGLLVNVAALGAVGVTPTVEIVLLTTVAIYAGGVLPGPPGRLGIFQYTCALAAQAFGVDPTTALLYATVEYVAVVVAPSLLGGLCLASGLVGGEPGRSRSAAAP